MSISYSGPIRSNSPPSTPLPTTPARRLSRAAPPAVTTVPAPATTQDRRAGGTGKNPCAVLRWAKPNGIRLASRIRFAGGFSPEGQRQGRGPNARHAPSWGRDGAEIISRTGRGYRKDIFPKRLLGRLWFSWAQMTDAKKRPENIGFPREHRNFRAFFNGAGGEI